MYKVTKRFEFDAAHRLWGYNGPCANLHGHHYVLEVTVRGTELDWLGMLIDFGELKRIVGSWLNRWWDHKTILHPDDPLSMPECYKNKLLGNPTVENMAAFLWEVFDGHFPESIELDCIRLYETPDSWVDYSK